MFIRNNWASLVLACIILFASCAKEGPTGPTGPTGPSFTGTISGHVFLYDQYGSPILSGGNTVRLSIAGSVAITVPTTVYDSNSFYQYAGVTTGTYTISAADTMTGAANQYGSTVISNINFLSGTLNQDIKLSKVPDSFLVNFFTGEKADSANDSLVIQVIPDTRLRNCMVFAYSSLGTSYLLHYVVPVPAGVSSVTLYVPLQDMLNAGLTKGQKVYYQAYSYVVNDASVYENTITGQNVYTAIYPVPFTDSTFVP